MWRSTLFLWQTFQVIKIEHWIAAIVYVSNNKRNLLRMKTIFDVVQGNEDNVRCDVVEVSCVSLDVTSFDHEEIWYFKWSLFNFFKDDVVYCHLTNVKGRIIHERGQYLSKYTQNDKKRGQCNL